MALAPQTVRVLALGGTIFGAGLGGLLVFSAARLRALGSHKGVFDFSEVTLFDTYNDSLAILITVIGTASIMLAVREGYLGFTDPTPGLSEAYGQATTDIDDAADDLIEDAIDLIEDIGEEVLDDAEDELQAAHDGPAALKAALLVQARRIETHNDAVRAARDAAQKAARKRSGFLSFIMGRASPNTSSVAPDLSAYDALILPRLDDVLEGLRDLEGTQAAPLRDAMHRLEAAISNATSDLKAALSAFRTEAPELDSLFDDEGDDDGTP